MSGAKDFIGSITKGLAVYISDNYMDVVRANLTPAGPKIVYLKRLPFVNKVKQFSYGQAKKEIDTALQKVIDFEKNPPYRIASNIKNDFLILRRFSMRNVPDEEFDQAVTFEIQKYMTYSVNNLSFMFKKCRKTTERIDVLFAGTQISRIEDITGYFKTRDVFVTVVEPIPCLIASALKESEAYIKGGLHLAIHYEPPNKAIIVGVWLDQPYFFREITLVSGEDEFSATEFNYPSLKDTWGLIEQDVVRAIEYMKKETSANIESIFFSGFAKHETDKDIANDFGLKFSEITFNKSNPDKVEDIDKYAPAVMLAMDMLKTPEFNIAPQSSVEKDPWSYKIPLFVMAGLLGLVLIAHMALGLYNASWMKKLESVKKDFKKYSILTPEATADDLSGYKKTLTQKTSFVKNAVAGRIIINEKLNDLGKFLPSKAWINNIVFENNIFATNGKREVILKGSILDVDGEGLGKVNDMVEEMRQDTVFMSGLEEIKLVSAQKRKSQNKDFIDFEITVE